MVNHSIPKNPLFNSDLKHFNLFLYHLLHTLLSKSKIPEISQSKPSLLNPCFSLTHNDTWHFLRLSFPVFSCHPIDPCTSHSPLRILMIVNVLNCFTVSNKHQVQF